MESSCNINGVYYTIKNKNDCIQSCLLSGSQWNEEIINIIKSYISEKNLHHFLNIGCHIGSVCIPISFCIDNVTAIEAYPTTYEHLCENIKLNNITNITTLNVAVGNSEEDIYFMSEEKICPVENVNRLLNNSGGMHIFTETDIENNIRSAILTDKKMKNKIIKLDNSNIENFDIMLIDIEGSENEFLLGASEKIKKNKPIIIIEIWHDDKRLKENMPTKQNEIINYIESLGYVLKKSVNNDFIFEPIK